MNGAHGQPGGGAAFRAGPAPAFAASAAGTPKKQSYSSKKQRRAPPPNIHAPPPPTQTFGATTSNSNNVPRYARRATANTPPSTNSNGNTSSQGFQSTSFSSPTFGARRPSHPDQLLPIWARPSWLCVANLEQLPMATLVELVTNGLMSVALLLLSVYMIVAAVARRSSTSVFHVMTDSIGTKAVAARYVIGDVWSKFGDNNPNPAADMDHHLVAIAFGHAEGDGNTANAAGWQQSNRDYEQPQPAPSFFGYSPAHPLPGQVHHATGAYSQPAPFVADEEEDDVGSLPASIMDESYRGDAGAVPDNEDITVMSCMNDVQQYRHLSTPADLQAASNNVASIPNKASCYSTITTWRELARRLKALHDGGFANGEHYKARLHHFGVDRNTPLNYYREYYWGEASKTKMRNNIGNWWDVMFFGGDMTPELKITLQKKVRK